MLHDFFCNECDDDSEYDGVGGGGGGDGGDDEDDDNDKVEEMDGRSSREWDCAIVRKNENTVKWNQIFISRHQSWKCNDTKQWNQIGKNGENDFEWNKKARN